VAKSRATNGATSWVSHAAPSWPTLRTFLVACRTPGQNLDGDGGAEAEFPCPASMPGPGLLFYFLLDIAKALFFQERVRRARGAQGGWPRSGRRARPASGSSFPHGCFLVSCGGLELLDCCSPPWVLSCFDRGRERMISRC
jgi:hypothetical protein